MLVCNDRRWPETYRVMGLQGVEMVVLGYNTPAVNSQRPAEGPQQRLFHNRLSVQAGAYQNSTFVVAVAKGRRRGWPSADRRQPDRQSGRRDRRRGQDRRRRTAGLRLRSRRYAIRQAHHLRLRAPPEDRALRAHYLANRRNPAGLKMAIGCLLKHQGADRHGHRGLGRIDHRNAERVFECGAMP